MLAWAATLVAWGLLAVAVHHCSGSIRPWAAGAAAIAVLVGCALLAPLLCVVTVTKSLIPRSWVRLIIVALPVAVVAKEEAQYKLACVGDEILTLQLVCFAVCTICVLVETCYLHP